MRLAYRFTRDGDTALDAAQDAWAYLLRRLPTLRLHARLTTFMYPVVRSCAATASAKRRRRPRRAGALSGGTDPVSAPDAALVAAVESLPEGQREVLLMRVVHGMSPAEIAAALGIPDGTVKSRLHAALRSLRTHPAAERYF